MILRLHELRTATEDCGAYSLFTTAQAHGIAACIT